MKKRNWSADEKLAIVLEDLKERRSGVEICRELQKILKNQPFNRDKENNDTTIFYLIY